MAHVVFRKQALADLENLYIYIRDHDGGTVNAYGFVQRIRVCCQGLTDFPERGTRRNDIRPGLRILSFERRVIIAFEIRNDTVRIGRILYGGRNYERLLKRGR